METQLNNQLTKIKEIERKNIEELAQVLNDEFIFYKE